MFCRHSLENKILVELSRTPNLTATSIQKRIEKHRRNYTIQAVYQELRKMMSRGTVIKIGDKYSLRVGWVLELVHFVDRMYETTISGGQLSHLLPEDERKKAWNFTSLQELVVFWTQLDLLLLEHAPDGVLFEYVERVWFHLVENALERQFIGALGLKGSQYYLAVGEESALEKSYRKLVSGINAVVVYGQYPFRANQASYISVAGDYLVEVRIHGQLSAIIDKALDGFTASRSAESTSQVIRALGSRGKIRLTLTRDASKAKRLAKQFRDFFGVPGSDPQRN